MVQHSTNTADLDTAAPANFFVRLTELPWVVPLVELHALSKKKSTVYSAGATLVSGSLWMLTSGFRVFPLNKPVSVLDSVACKLLQSAVNKCPSLEQPPHVVVRRVRNESEIRMYRISSKLASYRISQALLRKAGNAVYTLERVFKEPHEVEGSKDDQANKASAIRQLISSARQVAHGVRRKTSFITAPVARNLRSIRRSLRTTRMAGLRHSAIEKKIQRRRRLTPRKRLPVLSATRMFAAGLLSFFLRPLGISLSQDHSPLLEMEQPLENENSPSNLETSPREKRKIVESDEDDLEDETRWWEELEAEGYDSDEDPDYEPLATSLPTSEDTLSEDICEDVSPQPHLDTSVTEDEDSDHEVEDKQDESVPTVIADEQSSTEKCESDATVHDQSSKISEATSVQEPPSPTSHESTIGDEFIPSHESSTVGDEFHSPPQTEKSLQQFKIPSHESSTVGDEFHSPPQTEKSLQQFKSPTTEEKPSNDEFHSPN